MLVGFVGEMNVSAYSKFAYQAIGDIGHVHKSKGRIGVGADRQSCDIE